MSRRGAGGTRLPGISSRGGSGLPPRAPKRTNDNNGERRYERPLNNRGYLESIGRSGGGGDDDDDGGGGYDDGYDDGSSANTTPYARRSQRRTGNNSNNHHYSASPTSTSSTPSQQENVIHRLQAQNSRLRAQLHQFNEALAKQVNSKLKEQRMKGRGRRPSKSGNRRGGSFDNGGTLADGVMAEREQELAKAHKRMEVFQRASEVLKRQIDSSNNPQKVSALSNTIKATQLEIKQMKKKNAGLKREMRRMEREFEEINDSQGDYPARITEMMDQVHFYKEKIRNYQQRHNRDQKYMRDQQITVVALQKKIKLYTRRVKEYDRDMNRYLKEAAEEEEDDGDFDEDEYYDVEEEEEEEEE